MKLKIPIVSLLPIWWGNYLLWVHINRFVTFVTLYTKVNRRQYLFFYLFHNNRGGAGNYRDDVVIDQWIIKIHANQSISI